MVCKVGPVLYSKPYPYPREPRVVLGIPQLMLARVYSFLA
jgi:hypothetical protein